MKKHNKTIFSFLLISALIISGQTVFAQGRIHFSGRDIFMSGMNVAWVNFARDLGPGVADTAQFRTIFKAIHNNGGNVMRLWLHTNGANTPQYDGSGKIIGPGINAIQNLKNILNIAWQYKIGLQLCLWSHDMLNISQISATQLDRNEKMLTDTAYTMVYNRNALIPMVKAVKGNPAIVGWEVFNEPEGISVEYGWSGRAYVSMIDIQRVINLVAGAIHRTDPGALVTSGANTMQTLTDVNVSAKVSSAQSIGAMTAAQKDSVTEAFNERHRTNLTTQQVVSYMMKIATVPNMNYYTDSRLIAAGGDTAGTLDYYNVHFYGTQSTSPFNNPYSFWQLSKPLVVGEFYMQDQYGVPWQNLYEQLYNTGYAGAMSWAWNDNYQGIQRLRTKYVMNEMYNSHREDVIINPKTGTIYKFTADASTIQKTDSTVLRWDVEKGSVVTLNGESVDAKGSKTVAPSITSTYTLIAMGEDTMTSTLIITVLQPGQIISFKAIPQEIGYGESSTLVWQTVKGSSVTLNGNAVNIADSLVVYPDSTNHAYTLIAKGDVKDSVTLSISLQPPDKVDRALGAEVTVSSNDSITNSFSKPTNINDGNYFTIWQAESGNGQWAQIDMGKIIAIKKIIIYWGDQGYAKQYSVQSSKDASSWMLLKSQYNGTGGTNGVEIIDNLQETGRYLVFLLQTMGSGAFKIREIEVFGIPATTRITADNSETPFAFYLSQNYPNPFNPSTAIKFTIPKESMVTLTVYNVLGQKVDEIINKQLPAGNYTANFDASRFGSGVYLYMFKAGNYVIMKKMLLLK